MGARRSEIEQFLAAYAHVAGIFAQCGLAAHHQQFVLAYPRLAAQQLIDKLRAAGIAMTLLFGDRRPVAEAIARQLGGMKVIAEVLPQDKDQVIRQLQQRGAVVAIVGDGINDAPALMSASRSARVRTLFRKT